MNGACNCALSVYGHIGSVRAQLLIQFGHNGAHNANTKPLFTTMHVALLQEDGLLCGHFVSVKLIIIFFIVLKFLHSLVFFGRVVCLNAEQKVSDV